MKKNGEENVFIFQKDNFGTCHNNLCTQTPCVYKTQSAKILKKWKLRNYGPRAAPFFSGFSL